MMKGALDRPSRFTLIPDALKVFSGNVKYMRGI
jgi:hypothetical protein